MSQIIADFFLISKVSPKILLSWHTRLAAEIHPADGEFLQAAVNWIF